MAEFKKHVLDGSNEEAYQRIKQYLEDLEREEKEKEAKRMKWLENLKNISSTNEPGKCPYCGSTEMDFSVKNVSNGIGYCDIWCNACKHAFHVSRMKTDGFSTAEKEVPDGLKY